MTRRQLRCAGLAVVAVVLASHVPGSRLAAQAIERSMTVSVVDEAGAPVADLGPTDFIIREDNVAREVLKVGPATEPMHIALLVDTSRASRENIAHYRTALPPFVTTLINANTSGAKNQVALLAFGERPTVITNYTSSLTELERGINRLWALDDSGAYLLDALYEVCQGFDKRETRRPVIVAITQEGKEFSNRHYDQVLGPLRESGAPFHALVLGTPTGALDDETRSRNIVLDEGTRGTGGMREQLLTPMALAARLKQLATVLTHQYLVTYAHPDSLIPPERVTVSAKAAGTTARGTLIKDKLLQGRR
jgi:von Willebrand factor type A domain